MKKYLKKFGIMFVMAFTIMLGTCISAFAATDDGVVGTSNLNGTTQNSAVVGDRLIAPEVGWKRYDDNEANIKYSDSFGTSNNQWFYGGTRNEAIARTNQYIKFAFYGSKLRLIDYVANNRTINSKISFDGGITFESCSAYGANDSSSQALYYEKTGLEKKIHNVIISIPAEGGASFCLDALDIDSDGYLQPYSDQPTINESISLNNSTMNLNIGDSQQLTATTTPAGAQVTWTTSDSSIATVDSNGNVTGIKEGTCTITVTTADGLTATCTVTVAKEEESISLNKSTTDLTTGDSEILVATTTPSEVNVTWSSSDTSVATVDQNGKVTAIGVGTATITATMTDGSNLSASCIVNVTANNGGNTGGTTTGASAIVNIAYAKGDNTNNAGGDVSIIFNGVPDTTLSVVKTASVKSVWVGDTFTYTIVVTNTGSKTAKAVVINDSAPNHIQFMPSGITTTQGTVDPSSSASNIVVNVGDIPPSGTVTITVPATVVL